MNIIREPKIYIYEKKENWSEKVPQKGDHIRVNRGVYNHHGIYISDEEVVHFTGQDDDSILDWSKNEVISTNLDRFLLCGVLEVKEYTDEEFEDLYPVEHIVTYARACLGNKGYSLIFNNCEHFANVCTLGRFRSRQVEGVFDAILNGGDILKKRRKGMGLFSWIGGLFGGNKGGGSRSTSSTTYTYEPDKAKIAEIEQETKIRLGHMEQEKIELIKNARLEVLEKEYYCKVAYEEAKARGLNYIAQTIIGMQSKLNEVAEKRLEIIEKGSLKIIKEIEGFYKELGEKIDNDNVEYNTKKLPLLLDTLERFNKESDSYKLYAKRVEDDMTMHMQSISRQYDNLSHRQNQVIEGFLKSKDKMMEQTAQITTEILDKVVINYSEVAYDSTAHQNILESKENNSNKLQIESRSEDK